MRREAAGQFEYCVAIERSLRGVLCVGVAALGACAHDLTPLPLLEGDSVAITRGGRAIGTHERGAIQTADGRDEISRQSMRVSVDDGKSTRLVEQSTQRIDHAGQVVALEHLSRAGRHETRFVASIDGNVATIHRTTRSGTTTATVDLPTGLRFDNGAGLLADWDPEKTPQLQFRSLDIRAPLIETITYRLATPRASDETPILLRTAHAEGQLRSASRFRFSGSGGPTRMEQPMLGHNVGLDASAGPPAGSSNTVRDSLLKSPYRISSATARNGHIRYTFAIDEPGFFVPQTGEQRVEILSDGVVLDVCKGCGPGVGSGEKALAQARKATFWLDSDNARLVQVAKNVTQGATSERQSMQRLQGWARKRIATPDFAGHFTAADALARRAGDCTESAVLLAALGRAAGIATRVASGMVYSRESYHGVSHAFMPHVWALAFVDGRWESFDSALGGFDATHIALNISDGDPGSIHAGHTLAGMLQFTGMTEVRKR